MKAFLICGLLTTSLLVGVKNKNTNTFVKLPVKSFSGDSIPPDIIDFTAQIKPIFVSHCSPCHFTGGKMYGRLPFDKDTTIVGHEEAVLRRIKDEKENALIKQYIQQQKNNR
ncbi:MAG TPA: hypothetical protein VH396_11635 [Chitinophagaceae bacterium]|jgi:hypothetical protein